MSTEFGLIQRILASFPELPGTVVVGPGDDAAVFEPPLAFLVAAADLLVEGRHFDLSLSTPFAAGYKAVAVNVSDIAAMGARASKVLLSLGAPDAATAEQVAAGVAEACYDFALSVIGGDTVSCPQVTVGVTILGQVQDAVLRSGARAGDVICVTGSLGAASAGLALWRDRTTQALEVLQRFESLVLAHARGRARAKEGPALAASGARAMIDISDGLTADLGHVASASGVALVLDVDAVPAAAGVAEAAEALSVPSERFTLSGGDDYELAVVLPADAVDGARAAVAPTPLTVIGRVEAGTGLRDASGRAIEPTGWDHFAS